VIAEI
jgi:sialic acid synthase SpsE